MYSNCTLIGIGAAIPLAIDLDSLPVDMSMFLLNKPARNNTSSRLGPRRPCYFGSPPPARRPSRIRRPNRTKPIVDEHVAISPRQFKAQLLDASDLVTGMRLAPANRFHLRLILHDLTKLAYPARGFEHTGLRRLYVRNCTVCLQANDDADLPPLEPDIDIQKTIINRTCQQEQMNNNQYDHIYSKTIEPETQKQKDIDTKHPTVNSKQVTIARLQNGDRGPVATNNNAIKQYTANEQALTLPDTTEKKTRSVLALSFTGNELMSLINATNANSFVFFANDDEKQ